jgi:hypothetical protein
MWWFEKYHGLDEIKAGLLPDGSNAMEINKQLAKFAREHYQKWNELRLGSLGKPSP